MDNIIIYDNNMNLLNTEEKKLAEKLNSKDINLDLLISESIKRNYHNILLVTLMEIDDELEYLTEDKIESDWYDWYDIGINNINDLIDLTEGRQSEIDELKKAQKRILKALY